LAAKLFLEKCAEREIKDGGKDSRQPLKTTFESERQSGTSPDYESDSEDRGGGEEASQRKEEPGDYTDKGEEKIYRA